MLCAEDLLLLLTDDGGRLIVPSSQVDVALAGAVVLELALMRRVDLAGPGDGGRAGRLIVRDPSPAGDQILDEGLAATEAFQGKKPTVLVKALRKNLRPVLYQRLAAAGMVQAGPRRMGLGSRTWPAADRVHRDETYRLVTQVLVGQAQPDTRSGALIALLHALKCEHRIVDPRPYGLSKRALRDRAADIAQYDWASEAVRRVIEQMAAAVTAVTVAAATSG